MTSVLRKCCGLIAVKVASKVDRYKVKSARKNNNAKTCHTIKDNTEPHDRNLWPEVNVVVFGSISGDTAISQDWTNEDDNKSTKQRISWFAKLLRRLRCKESVKESSKAPGKSCIVKRR